MHLLENALVKDLFYLIILHSIECLNDSIYVSYDKRIYDIFEI